MLHAISTGVMVLLGVGLYVRQSRPALHWKLMVGAFLVDILLVLYIEFTRHAVEGLPKAGPLLLFHVAVSLSVIGCYLANFMLGRRLLRGRGNTRGAHRNVGIAFVTLRSLNYVTSFLV